MCDGFTRKGSIVFDSEFERNLFDLRKSKLVEIEKLGQAAYPNHFAPRTPCLRCGRSGARRRVRPLKPAA